MRIFTLKDMFEIGLFKNIRLVYFNFLKRMMTGRVNFVTRYGYCVVLIFFKAYLLFVSSVLVMFDACLHIRNTSSRVI